MNNEKINVSVVVPIYNGENFIDSLITNFKNQTYNGFEVIAVNDGSKDSTKEKLESYNNKNLEFQLTVINQENSGVSAARNRGIKEAKGDYICFVDADDIISKDYIELLYNAAETQNSNIAVAYMSRNIEELQTRENVTASLISSTEMLEEYLYRGNKYTICACIFKKDVFFERNLFFPEGYKYSEDVFVLWSWFAAEKNVAIINCCIYYYYNNPTSAMNKGMDVGRLDAIYLMKKLEEILPELNPEFASQFQKFVVARHHWSILWQAAIRIDGYKNFVAYCKHFEMKKEIKKMLSYPQLLLAGSSLVYVISPFLYYFTVRALSFLKKN
jgi:glycosyltransferase involved in cell wall biosynthesis